MFAAQSLEEYVKSPSRTSTRYFRATGTFHAFCRMADSNVFIVSFTDTCLSAIYFLKYPNDNVVKTSRLLKARIKFTAIAAKRAAEAESGDVELTPSDDKKFGGNGCCIIRSTCSLLPTHGVMEYPSKY